MERTILDKLLLIANLLQRDMARAFAGTPLTEARVSVLWVLQTLGPSTQQAIADALERMVSPAPEQWHTFKPMWPATAAEEQALAERAATSGDAQASSGR